MKQGLGYLIEKNSIVFCLASLVFAGICGSTNLWSIHPYPVAAPLDSSTFLFGFDILHGYRAVIPFAGPAISFIYTYGGVLILFTSFFIFRRIFHERWRDLFSLIILLAAVPLAQPGESLRPLFDWFLALLIIASFLGRWNGFELWILSSSLLWISFSFSHLSLPIFASFGAYLWSESLHFLLVDRGRVPWKLRSQKIPTALRSVGWCILSISIILISRALLNHAQPIYPQGLIFPVVITLLSTLICWMSPWESKKWIRVAMFSWIVLLSKDSIPAAIILIVLLSIILIQKSPWPQFVNQRQFKIALGVFLFLTPSLIFLGLNQSTRRFSFDWVRAPYLLENKNYAIVSNSLPFLAQVHKGKLISNTHILTLTSEELLSEWLSENKMNAIIIEKKFFLQFWKAWMRSGRSAEASNKSIISRLITGNDQEVSTATLKLNKIEKFKISALDSAGNLLVVKEASGGT